MGFLKSSRSNGDKMNEMQVRLLLLGEERLKLRSGTVISWVRGGYAPLQHDPSADMISLEKAYEFLSLSQRLLGEELKKAYRLKAADFHPDKLRSKDLPEEFVAFANDQLGKD